MAIRDEKAASMLVHLAADFIAREAGRKTLITPTRAAIGRDRKNATIFISVFPDADTAHAVEFLERHADDFRDFMKTEARFSFLPRVRFEEDLGEKNRQHLDDISRGLS